jgi:hypothetical protein
MICVLASKLTIQLFKTSKLSWLAAQHGVLL